MHAPPIPHPRPSDGDARVPGRSLPHTTILLSRILGVYLTAVAILFVAAPGAVLHLVQSLLASRNALLASGMTGLAGGIAIVAVHSVWKGGLAPVLVTLVGWLVIAKCVLLIVLPPAAEAALLRGVGYPDSAWLYSLIDLAMGVYLLHAGFLSAAARHQHGARKPGRSGREESTPF